MAAILRRSVGIRRYVIAADGGCHPRCSRSGEHLVAMRARFRRRTLDGERPARMRKRGRLRHAIRRHRHPARRNCG